MHRAGNRRAQRSPRLRRRLYVPDETARRNYRLQPCSHAWPLPILLARHEPGGYDRRFDGARKRSELPREQIGRRRRRSLRRGGFPPRRTSVLDESGRFPLRNAEKRRFDLF